MFNQKDHIATIVLPVNTADKMFRDFGLKSSVAAFSWAHVFLKIMGK